MRYLLLHLYLEDPTGLAVGVGSGIDVVQGMK
jgi:hypothetical protein